MTAVLVVFTSLLLSRLARFSFVYQIRVRRWLIVDHHPSLVPAPSP